MVDKFETPEEVIEYARARNNNQRTASISESLSDKLLSHSSRATDASQPRTEETRKSDGSVETIGDNASGGSGLSGEPGQDNGAIAGSNPGLDKYVGTRGTEERTGQSYSSLASKYANVKSKFKGWQKKILPESIGNKEDTEAPKKTVRTGKRISDAEGMKLRPKLIATILWTSEHADNFLEATTKGHEEVEIWSSIDETEAEILADFMIERGKQSEVVAGYVRRSIALYDQLKIVVIVAPRLYKTLLLYLKRGISIY